jgi:hypothetical protein
MNNKLIEDGRPDVPTGCFDRAADMICQQGHVGGSPNEATSRCAVDDWRISLHESGHVIVGRAFGNEIGGVTIIPSKTYGGLTWGPNHFQSGFDGSAVDDDIVVPDLAEKIGALMPGPGESRSEVVDIFTHVHIRVVELCAYASGEGP